ncbi:hypothetical protein ACQCVH_16215 [Bacillus infantis]|jgi:hypothetical protein
MKKWAISAAVYLLLVVCGYYIYDTFIAEPPAEPEHGHQGD